MTTEADKLRFLVGDTAEDFANKVVDGLRDESGELQIPGVVRIACEDFTLPDSLVFLGGTELNGVSITYHELFAGAMEHFHGIKPSRFQAIPNREEPPMTPFSMSLAVSFDTPAASPEA